MKLGKSHLRTTAKLSNNRTVRKEAMGQYCIKY